MTVPYYLFTDAGIEVDLASPSGGEIAIEIHPVGVQAGVRVEAVGIDCRHDDHGKRAQMQRS